eukprot:TRINITY_DN5243_c0_g1_i16.p1 TRINITY_DN5243_c0_g1~~TRINITY_DN5243_c0_g1_i16.p1  ORF type:complete len:437 (-),score=79.06 TRINITY_DN5243_c0_g1_i16:398-1708(-)
MVYGGLIFFVILSFPLFATYGTCGSVPFEFHCLTENNDRLVYLEVYRLDVGRTVGLYVPWPPQCGSVSYYLDDVIPDSVVPRNDSVCGTCLYPVHYMNHSSYVPFKEEYYMKSGATRIQDASTALCTISSDASDYALAAVLVLVAGFVFDQLVAVFTDQAKEKLSDETNGLEKIGLFTFSVTCYNLASGLMVLGNWLMIVFLREWENSGPKAGGCEGPGLISTLLIVLSSLCILVESLEWVYYQVSVVWPNWKVIRCSKGIKYKALSDYIIHQHYVHVSAWLSETLPGSDEQTRAKRYLYQKRLAKEESTAYQYLSVGESDRVLVAQLVAMEILAPFVCVITIWTRIHSRNFPIESRVSEVETTLKYFQKLLLDRLSTDSDPLYDIKSSEVAQEVLNQDGTGNESRDENNDAVLNQSRQKWLSLNAFSEPVNDSKR